MLHIVAMQKLKKGDNFYLYTFQTLKSCILQTVLFKKKWTNLRTPHPRVMYNHRLIAASTDLITSIEQQTHKEENS